MGNKILIDVFEDNTLTAGSKARNDAIEILKNDGFIIKSIKEAEDNSKFALFKNLFQSYKTLKNILKEIKEESTIFIQFPWNSMALPYAKKIQKASKDTKSKSVVLIHDLNSLRTNSKFGKLYFDYIVNEIKFLNCFDLIIAHNDSMKEYLINKGIVETKIVSLQLFDYLVDNEIKNRNLLDYKKVVIAGNLSNQKAGYIYKFNELNNKNYKFELYGTNYSLESRENVNYNGAFKPTELINEINYGFGLVWDGEILSECSGKYGEYLKLNNPHKLSLYMACGIPVIVWKKAALAKFVEKNNVGIVIDSLYELEEIFDNMTEEKYEKLHENVKIIQNKVLNGEFLKEILKFI